MNLKKTLWFLGASDPEMAHIEELLRATDQRVAYATKHGKRATPAQAYAADLLVVPRDVNTVVFVEAKATLTLRDEPWGRRVKVVVVDHHRPGDPGYGAPCHLYWEASSIGQVWSILAKHGKVPQDPPPELLIVAAADHCPAAAYQGLCPGVDPETLAIWRARTRAEFQRRRPEELLEDVKRASEVILGSPVVDVAGVQVHVVPGHVPELPEASLRVGKPVLYRLPAQSERGAPPSASWKEGILGDVTGEAVRELLERWKTDPETVGDPWGDPARGFAGRWVR